MNSKETYSGISTPLRIFIVFTMLTVFAGLIPVPKILQAAGNISGIVYQDYNNNGTNDTTATIPTGGGTTRVAIDVGVGGVNVTALDAGNNVIATTTSNSDGTYTLSSAALTALAPGTPLRIEFSGIPSGLQPGAFGTDNGTTVRFVTATAGTLTNINLGLVRPADYCENNPDLIIPCYVGGATSGANSPRAGDPVVVNFRYSAGNISQQLVVGAGGHDDSGYTAPIHPIAVTHGQVGSVYGVAYQKSTRRLFVSAFTKRLSGFGPAGPGGIYVIDISTGTATTATTFTTLTAGADPHNFAGVNPNDQVAADDVGKNSLGDMDIYNDDTLLVINLADRALYRIPIATPASATSFVVPTALPGATQGCTAANVRPFGLGVNNINNLVYVGLVCDGPTNTDIRAYVYSFNPGTNTYSTAPVLEFPLNYGRLCANGAVALGPCVGGGNQSADWRPWADTFGPLSDADPTAFPQAILGDISFDKGDMIVALRDRFGDQGLGSRPAGDVLLACATGANSWVSETAGGCATRTATNGTNPPNTRVRSGVREYFHGDFFIQFHEELSMGSVAQIPGFPETVIPMFDPVFSNATGGSAGVTFDGGVRWLDNGTTTAQAGNNQRAYRLYNGAGNPTGPNASNFGKASGVGDLDFICNAAPLEIGNRVWRDENGNGRQDPGEPPLVGVTVELISGTTVIATALTNANGEYYFSNDPRGYPVGGNNNPNVTTGAGVGGGFVNDNQGGRISTASNKYGISQLQQNRNYQIRIPNFASQAPLSGLSPTIANAVPDQIDSDGTVSGANNVINLTTGSVGNNNHTYDFGFVDTYSLGNRVWFDTNNDGIRQGTELPVPGVVVELRDPTTGTLISTTTTDATGYYLFNDLIVGNYRVVITNTNFTGSGVLVNYLNSTGNTTGTDDRDNGVDNPNPAVNGISSATITLGPGDTIIGEGDTGGPGTGGRTDNRSNLTVDFGFYRQSVGNLLWYDGNNNGIFDSGTELPLPAGVTVELRDGTTNAVISTTTTNASGIYNFDGLAPGTYYVNIPGGQPAINNHTPSTPVFSGLDNQNNGTGSTAAGNNVRSANFTLTPGSATQGAVVTNTTATTNNPTLDFGFVPPFSLGNRLWFDTNNDGIFDPTEQPIPGVSMQLLDSGGNVISTTTTDANGYYLFDNLASGQYSVRVAASNFTGSGVLVGYTNSTPTVNSSTNTTDNRDNGQPVADPTINGVTSNPVTLTVGTVPTGEPDTGGPGAGQPDNRSNLTVDFGFFRLSVGNQLWYDLNNDGVYNSGTEPPIVGVTIQLVDNTGTVISTTTTDALGQYNFNGLTAGQPYRIVIPGGQSSLLGYNPSTPVSSGVDSQNNGTGSTASGNQVQSGLFTLTPGGTSGGSTVDNPTATTRNPTLDFGFFGPPPNTYNIGNRIWFDTNNNGQIDAGEAGVDGVSVSLFASDASGNPTGGALATQSTSSGGYYRFDNLPAGAYVVVVNGSNFSGSGVLAGYLNSSGATNSTTNTTDSRDNGIDNNTPASGGIRSGRIVLGPGDNTPTGENDRPNPNPPAEGPDGRSNLTIDFGFYRLSMGNLLWYDDNNNGVVDSGESPVPAGVTVEIRDATTNAVISTTTTNASGVYLFTGLLPGNYYINIPGGQAALTGSVPSSTATGGVDNRNNGTGSTTAGSNVRSGNFTLTPGSTSGGATVNNSTATTNNSTLDFGFFRQTTPPATTIPAGTTPPATTIPAGTPSPTTTIPAGTTTPNPGTTTPATGTPGAETGTPGTGTPGAETATPGTPGAGTGTPSVPGTPGVGTPGTGLTPTPTASSGQTPPPGTSFPPDPYISKVTDSGVAVGGQNLKYIIRVTNPGSVAIINTVVTDELLPVLTYVNATTTQGTISVNNQTVTVNIGTLQPGQTVTIELTVRIRDGFVGTVLNRATVTGSTDSGTPITGSSGTIVELPGLPNTGQGNSDFRLLTLLGLLFSGFGIILTALAFKNGKSAKANRSGKEG